MKDEDQIDIWAQWGNMGTRVCYCFKTVLGGVKVKPIHECLHIVLNWQSEFHIHDCLTSPLSPPQWHQQIQIGFSISLSFPTTTTPSPHSQASTKFIWN